jgi:hypothetical protein
MFPRRLQPNESVYGAILPALRGAAERCVIERAAEPRMYMRGFDCAIGLR